MVDALFIPPFVKKKIRKRKEIVTLSMLHILYKIYLNNFMNIKLTTVGYDKKLQVKHSFWECINKGPIRKYEIAYEVIIII